MFFTSRPLLITFLLSVHMSKSQQASSGLHKVIPNGPARILPPLTLGPAVGTRDVGFRFSTRDACSG